MALRLTGVLRAASVAVLLLAVGPSVQAAANQSSSGLKLSVIAPDPASIGDRLALDVSFRGGAVAAVEVYLDGALVAKRQLADTQTHGVMTFVLETMLLTEGDHDLVIKAFDPDGRSVTAPARIRIPGPDLSAPVRIAYPLNGVQVSGTVPIRVKVDEELQRQRPYVTFFINKELKVLRNYPPYEYNWDTTTYPNGWHTLEAWTQSPDMAAPYKSRPVNVNVNNSGGYTQRQREVEDLRPTVTTTPPARSADTQPQPAPVKPQAAAVKQQPAVAQQKAVQPQPVQTRQRPAGDPQRSIVLSPEPVGPASQGPGAPASGSVKTTAVAGMRIVEPTTRGGAQRSIPNVQAPAVAPLPDRMPRVATRMVGPRPVEPSGVRRVASAPKVTTVTVKHGETLADVSRKTGVSAKEIARLNNVKPHEATALQAGHKLVVPQVGAFDVAFDGVVLAFDVQPRVEAGIGLVPIRQIFEHAGGWLYWYGAARTVRAVNNTREIELKIGSPTATVNNRTLTLERAPFIDSGRTLVPLTFVRDALSVDARYDEATGRVLLRTK